MDFLSSLPSSIISRVVMETNNLLHRGWTSSAFASLGSDEHVSANAATFPPNSDSCPTTQMQRAHSIRFLEFEQEEEVANWAFKVKKLAPFINSNHGHCANGGGHRCRWRAFCSPVGSHARALCPLPLRIKANKANKQTGNLFVSFHLRTQLAALFLLLVRANSPVDHGKLLARLVARGPIVLAARKSECCTK